MISVDYLGEHWFFSSIAGLFVFFLTYLVIVEVLNYKALDRFRALGIETYYFPIIGVLRYIMQNRESDSMEPYKEMLKKNSKAKMICSNYVRFTGRSLINLCSPATITKFLAIEPSVSYRESPLGPMNAGFFFIQSEKAFKEKQIFTHFFEFEKLKTYHAPIHKIAQEAIKDFNKKFELSKDEYKTVNIQ